MKRLMMIRIASMILVLLMLSTPFAMADLERGDRGDDVAELQQLLFESGWLFELPDGIFGRNTEEAVRGFEEYADLPVDGIADNQMIYELAVSLEALNEETGIVSDCFGAYPSVYFGEKYMGFDYSYGDTDDFYEDDGGMIFAACCIQTTEVDGSSRTDYCEKHHSLHADTYDMLTYGDLASARQASDMWYEEVGNLYDEWAALVPEEERGAIIANRATFLASVEALRTAAEIGVQSEEKRIKTEVGVSQTLRNQSAWLCGMIWEQKNSVVMDETGNAQGPVALNASVIIDGDLIYYAGSIAGEGSGVYVMNLNGGDRRMISDIDATLEAVSNGNLLVWHYDHEAGCGALEILRADGTLETVAQSRNGHAIAHGGRFYYGGSSVAEDGSDHQLLLRSEPEYHDCYWPLKVTGGYLYYLDSSSGAVGYNESGVLPVGAELGRLNLKTGDVELISGVGTRFIGIEDGSVYYTRENFYVFSEDGESFSVEVDQGLYCMNLEVLAETKLADIDEGQLVFDDYTMLCDGVVYGERFDYQKNPDGEVSIIGVKSSGEMVRPVFLEEGDSIDGSYAMNSMYFGTGRNSYEEGDDYYSCDVIMSIDMDNGEIVEIELPANEAVSYTELTPRIAVIDGRIYYYVYDWDEATESLKAMNMDGSDVRTLIKSEPLQ